MRSDDGGGSAPNYAGSRLEFRLKQPTEGRVTTVKTIADFLNEFAPLDLAEDWDNVGLLLGSDTAGVKKVLTCLTLTEDVADEAVSDGFQLIVSHHPILFKKVQRLTNRTIEGRMLLKLLHAGIAVYSPHTSYDSAGAGINQQLAECLGLKEIGPIRELETDSDSGSGRLGSTKTKMSQADLVQHVKASLGLDQLQFVSGDGRDISKVGVACGSAAEFLRDAERKGCDALVTGEARFHSLLEARSRGVALILLGHYSSERPAMEHMAEVIAKKFPKLNVQPSTAESDPLEWA